MTPSGIKPTTFLFVAQCLNQLRPKARLCGRSLAGIDSSNPAAGMDICLLLVLCVVRGACEGPITRPEESYRLWCVVVCEEALARFGLLRPIKRIRNKMSDYFKIHMPVALLNKNECYNQPTKHYIQ